MAQIDVDVRAETSYPPTLSPSIRRGRAPASRIPLWERGGAQRQGERFLTAVILLICAITLSTVAAGPNTLPGDVAVGRWVQDLDSAIVDIVAWGGNFIGEGRIVFTAAIAMVAYSLFLRLWHDVYFLVLLVVLRLASLVLKGIVESPRPTAEDLRLAQVYEEFGYPSGHTTSATVLAGALIVLLLRRVHDPAWRRVGLVACLLIPLVTGFARVYVGAHWPSDVLGGYLWGTLIVLLASDLSHRLPRRRQSGVPSIRTA
jgi:membrane-associated phospholipid phosphatase